MDDILSRAISDGYLLRHLHSGERIVFQCIDKNGQVVATYQHRSEAETYWRASVEGAEFDEGGAGNPAEIIVFDHKGDDVGSIKMPGKREASPASRRRADRALGGTPDTAGGQGDDRLRAGNGGSPGDNPSDGVPGAVNDRPPSE